MTVHLVRRPRAAGQADVPRVGFVVSKGVGNAVVRHRTQRRLRHLMARRLGLLPERADLVVRAHPAAASASSAQLDAELDRLLKRGLGALETSAGSPV